MAPALFDSRLYGQVVTAYDHDGDRYVGELLRGEWRDDEWSLVIRDLDDETIGFLWWDRLDVVLPGDLRDVPDPDDPDPDDGEELLGEEMLIGVLERNAS